MNLLDKSKEQLAQMEKYQKWAHDNGLYSNISIYIMNHGKYEQYPKDKNGKTCWDEPKVMVDSETQYELTFGCQPKSYSNVKAFQKEFGIRKLDKGPSIDEKELDFSAEQNGVKIKLYAVSELGPRCKVVYEEVVVPASEEYVIEAKPEHVKKVAKVICN